ncbi:MAG: rhamnulokinase [Vicinamibacteria bacterium]|nr:rhamnulokinase [Vicinamibacteria bacterium]
MAERVYLAIDLGAESGRVIAGIWNGATIRLEEVSRFPNGPVALAGTLRWDVLRLWDEIQQGLKRAARLFGGKVVSVGADAWGVDFILLTRKGGMLGHPYHYRDARTRGMLDQAFLKVPRREIFAQTGLQFMEINTLYQLLAVKRDEPELLAAADHLLLVPDFMHWCLCGSCVVEFTNGTTTQCMHPVARDWAKDLLDRFDLPVKIFPEVVPPGTKLGKLRGSIAAETDLAGVEVVAPPTHDTAAAVVGVPAAGNGAPNWAYVSSGTWSLAGVEMRDASLSERTLALNFTNEGGLDGTYRLLKNIMGLWLIQQCRRSFEARGGSYDYAALGELALSAAPLRSIVDPDDARFFNPPDMPAAIQEYCRETGQPAPESEGALVRCAVESLALKCAMVLERLQELTDRRIEIVHIVGGGSRNVLLDQLTSDACRRPVVAGPVEATAMGNLLTQARADGEIGSLAEIRDVVRRSTDPARFEPTDSSEWRDAEGRFAALVERSR